MKKTYGAHTYGEIGNISPARGELIVGKYCSIAANVNCFYEGDHNMDTISTFPFYHHGRPINKLMSNPKIRVPGRLPQKSGKDKKIIVGNDVWIGYGVLIFKGVTVGDGACIGAFTKVTKNIPPYSVVVGNSRIVRKRFSDEDIEFLLRLKWWNFPDQEVADIAPILHNPDVGLLRQWAKEHKNIT